MSSRVCAPLMGVLKVDQVYYLRRTLIILFFYLLLVDQTAKPFFIDKHFIRGGICHKFAG